MRESKKRAEAERPKVVKVSDIDAKEEEKAEEQPEEQTEKQPEEQPEVIEDAEIIEEETREADKPLDEAPPAEEAAEKEIAEEEAAEEKIEEEKTEEEKTKEEGTAEAGNSYTAREMSRSEREQFAPFIHHKKTRKQIVEVIDNISLASYTGNVVITGEEGTGTTALAKLLVKEIQLSDNNFSGKVAKISGGNMNKKEVGATLDRLLGGALIIEGAASMKKNTVESLIRELNQEGKGLIIILEDKKEAIEKFLTKYPALATIFNLRVDVEALDDQTLVKYARKYALEQEYAIDELGVLALHTRIADMQTSDHEVTLSEIEEIVDEAIYYADKKTPKHFFDVLFGKRYDDEDMVVLREKDFMHY